MQYLLLFLSHHSQFQHFHISCRCSCCCRLKCSIWDDRKRKPLRHILYLCLLLSKWNCWWRSCGNLWRNPDTSSLIISHSHFSSYSSARKEAISQNSSTWSHLVANGVPDFVNLLLFISFYLSLCGNAKEIPATLHTFNISLQRKKWRKKTGWATTRDTKWTNYRKKPITIHSIIVFKKIQA